MIFPQNFPFAPPFIRVIRPRFMFRTGHVTIGGSICTEMLTNKVRLPWIAAHTLCLELTRALQGWSPANTIEATLVSIRTNLITANPPAALDLTNRMDYTEPEARDAFNRMVAQHGW